MKRLLIEISFLYLISATLCLTHQYNCDHGNISCGCGLKNVDLRDDNDHPVEAIPYSWSMMVSIRYDCLGNGDSTTHCCVGTILNDRYILTTARCLKSRLLPGNITIAAGIHRLSQHSPSVRVVDQWFIHPNWTSNDAVIHDIALLRLAEPLNFHTDFIIRKTCFPFPMNTALPMKNRTNLVAVGWSAWNQSNDNINKVVQQMNVHVMNSSDAFCARSVANDQLFICTGRYADQANVSSSSFRILFLIV